MRKEWEEERDEDHVCEGASCLAGSQPGVGCSASMFCLSHICCYQRRSASKCLSSFSHPDTQCNRPTSMVRLTRRRSPRWAWTSLTYGATSVTSQAPTRMAMKSTSMGRGTRRTCWAGCHRDCQGKRRKKPLWSTTTPSPPRLWKSPPIPKCESRF